MSTGAQIIVSELEDAGVSVCFGLPGVHNLALWAALRESSIRLIGVRHEQAAAYAAVHDALATPTRPVYLEIATDLLGSEVPEGNGDRSPVSEPTPDLRAVGALLDRAERPLIWAGGGARDAGNAVGELARTLG